MIADLRASRQDNLSFRKDASKITFFPTAGPASRTKLGTHVGIHTVVKRQCWLGGQLRRRSCCRQNGDLSSWGLSSGCSFHLFWQCRHPTWGQGVCGHLWGKSVMVNGAMGLCWKIWVVDNSPGWDGTLMDEINVCVWPTCNTLEEAEEGGLEPPAEGRRIFQPLSYSSSSDAFDEESLKLKWFWWWWQVTGQSCF